MRVSLSLTSGFPSLKETFVYIAPLIDSASILSSSPDSQLLMAKPEVYCIFPMSGLGEDHPCSNAEHLYTAYCAPIYRTCWVNVKHTPSILLLRVTTPLVSE